MLRFSLITLRSFLNSSTSTNKRKLISFPFNNTTLKCNFYACQKNLKKQGQWSKDDKSDETVKKSVKGTKCFSIFESFWSVVICSL